MSRIGPSIQFVTPELDVLLDGERAVAACILCKIRVTFEIHLPEMRGGLIGDLLLCHELAE